MYPKIILIILVALGLFSCNTKEKPAEKPPVVDVDALRASMAPKVSAPIVQSGTTPTLNPAHGQPGHRCDVAVGAPLNKVNIATNNATSASTPVVQAIPQGINTQAGATTKITMPQKATVATAKGMNPPHGQPNHRCDIPVGAPLNSKPATTQVTTQASAPKQAIEQPKFNEKGELLNPSHGQAKHRCDIAVGMPLNSKPAQEVVKPVVVPATSN